MTASSKNPLVSKRTARTFEEDGGVPVDNPPAWMARRCSADPATPDPVAEKEHQSGRVSGTPSQGKEARVGEVGVEYSDNVVALRSSPSEKVPLSPKPSKSRPLNFGMVVPGIYRCSQPTANDLEFIRNLGLRTVISLVGSDDLNGDFTKYIVANNINHLIIGMRGTKKESIPLSTMKSILQVVLDRKQHPVLLHCSHGKHRTGCVVAVIRKVSGWNLPNTLDEYRSYASPKIRDCDVDYISGFQISDLGRPCHAARNASWKAPFRIRTFFRAVLLSLVIVLVWLWLVSSAKLASSRPAILE